MIQVRTEFTAGESPSLSSPVAQWLDTREVYAEDGVVLIPDRELLLTSMYARTGVDLIINTPGGVKYVVKGFFLNDTLPTLSDGANTHIPGELAKQFAGSIAPEQYAQAAGAAAGPVIGVVRSMNGDVRVIRASDGSEVVLKIGDALYQDDIVETGAGGTVGLVFIDGTTLALGEDGELVLDELVYDPSKAVGKGTLRLVSGAAEFVSGGIAKSGADAMTFQTPVATIGIRGTRVFASYDPQTGDITVLNRPTGTDVAGNQTAGIITLTLPNGTVIGDATLSNQGWQWNPVVGTQPTPVTLTEQQVQNIAGAVLDTVNNLQTQISQQPNIIPTPQGGGTNAPTGGPAGPGGPGDGGAGGAGPGAGDGGGAPPTTPTPQVTQTPGINTGNVAATLGATGNPNTTTQGPAGTTGTAGTAGTGTTNTNGQGGTNTNPVITQPTDTNPNQQQTPPQVLPQPVLFSIEGGSTNDSEAGTITFTITRSGNLGVAASVNYATGSGTAGAGTDFTANAGTVSFAPGEVSKTVSISVLVNPGVVEQAEAFTVSLNGGSAAAGTPTTIAVGSATGTIVADPPLPLVAIGDASAIDAVTGSAVLTVTRTGPLDAPSTIGFRTLAGSASSGADFIAATGSVSFSAGQATAQVTVGIVGDTATTSGEAVETFQVELFDPVGAIVAAGAGTATVTIGPDPLATFSIAGATVVEGGAATVIVTRGGDLTRPVSVGYATQNGSAAAGSDFVATNGVVIFAAGQTTATIRVATVVDNTQEAAESFSVVLSNPIGGTISQGTATVSVAADPPLPTLSISGGSGSDAAAGSAVFTVTMSAARTVPVTVNYVTTSGSAEAGSDFTAASGTLTIAAGQTSGVISVPILANAGGEPDESFSVVLSAPSGATIATGSASFTISADPVTLPSITITDVTVSDASPGNAVFQVNLSSASSTTVTVQYTTSAISANSSDFTPTSGTMTFEPGIVQHTITVPILANAAGESEETFGVVLSNAVGATIADSLGVGTITADTSSGGNSPPTLAGFYGGNGYLQFDGIDDVFLTEYNVADSNWDPLTSHTAELWVRTAVATGSHALTQIIDSNSSAWMGIKNGKLRVVIEVDGEIKAVETTDTVADNTWHHVGYTFSTDADNPILLYVDGELASSTLAGDSTIGLLDEFTTSFEVDSLLQIGGTGAEAFLGSMDEIRLWDGARTLVEIGETYGIESWDVGSSLLVYYSGNNFSPGFTYILNDSEYSSSYDADAYGASGSQNGPRGVWPNFYSALKLGDATQYVETNVLNLDHSFSLTAEIRLDEGVGGGNRTIFSKAYGSGDFEFVVYVDDDNRVIFEMRHTGGVAPDEIISSITLEADLWYGIGVTFDDITNEFKLYVNGVEVGSETLSSDRIVGFEALRLGGLDGFSWPLSGDVTNVTVWEKALSDINIDDYFGYPVSPDEEGLLAAFLFADGTGSTVSNSLGFSDAQIFGTAQWLSEGAPIITPHSDASIYTREDTPILIRIAGHDSDAGQTLTYSAPISATDNGGTIHHVSGNIFRYTPGANESGSDQFEVRITDSNGLHTDQTIHITVESVNDRPLLINTNTLPDVIKDDTNPDGTLLADIFGSNFVDPDGYFNGVVVIGNDANAGTQGAWQYSTNNGSNWYDIGTVANDLTALVLGSSTELRFLPVAGYSGSPPGLAVRALDSWYGGSVTSGATRKTLGSDSNATSNTFLGPITSIQANVIVEYTWDGGGGDGLWQTGANWLLDRTPISDDRVLLNGATATLNNASNYLMTRLSIGASGHLAITSTGASITTSAGGSLASGGSILVNGTFTTNGAFTNHGAWDISGNTGLVNGTGAIANASGGVVTVSYEGRIDLTGTGSFTNKANADLVFTNIGTTTIRGYFVNEASGAVEITSSVNDNADIEFASIYGFENSGVIDVNAGAGGDRTLDFVKFTNKNGGILNINTNTTLSAASFEGEYGSRIAIAPGVVLTLESGEFTLNGDKFGGPQVYPLGGVAGGGQRFLQVKGDVTLITEHGIDIPRSGGYLTVDLGEQGGSPAFWESYGDSGFSYEVDVEGELNIYSAELDVTPVARDYGIVNVIDATGTSGNDSVTWLRGFGNWNYGTINVKAVGSDSTLTVYSYVDDGTGDDSPSTDSSELFSDNYGLFTLQPGTGYDAELILDGLDFRNQDSGILAVSTATGDAKLTLRNGAQFTNLGTVKLDAASSTSYARLTVGGDLTMAGTLMLVGAGYTAASAGHTFTSLLWTGDLLTRFEDFDGIVTANGLVAFDPVYSSSSLTLTGKTVDHVATSGADVYTILNVLGGVATGGDDADMLVGNIGSDLLIGGAHADTLMGGAGDDRLLGGDGVDSLAGGSGNDDLYGGDGDDDLVGGDDNDYLSGGLGDDDLNGEAGNDIVVGGPGGDYLYGGAGDDILYGGADGDNLFGEAGNDILYGGKGADTLSGGDDNDVLIGGFSDDTLTGGSGADEFVYLSWRNIDGNSEMYDTINDFVSGTDKIVLDLEGFGFFQSSVVAGVNFFAQSGSYGGNLNDGDASEWDAGRPVLIYDSDGLGALYFDPDGNLNDESYQTVIASFNGQVFAASDIVLTSTSLAG